MKTKSKTFVLALCAVLLVAGSGLGTYAYLTDSDGVTNTFTVGQVGLTLDEADVKPDGTLDTKTRVWENEYHLLPGHTYIKDPTVTVDANSEDAYVRMGVKVERIDRLKAALPDDGVTAKYYTSDAEGNRVFLLQMLCVDKDGKCTWDEDAWKFEGYTQSADGNTGIYEFRYKTIVSKAGTATKLPALFTHITVPGEIDNERLTDLKDVKIIVNAHAIQADGFDTADQAWDAFDN